MRNRLASHAWLSLRTLQSCLAIILALLCITSIPASAATAKDVSATWHGYWTSPEGFQYEADMTLSVDDQNAVTGAIRWTLRKSPRPAEQAKIDMSGVEHVSGIYLPGSGAVKIEGTSVEDPNHILGTDKYRLILSDDAKVLGGITWDHGPWTGQIYLHRQ